MDKLAILIIFILLYIITKNSLFALIFTGLAYLFIDNNKISGGGPDIKYFGVLSQNFNKHPGYAQLINVLNDTQNKINIGEKLPKESYKDFIEDFTFVEHNKDYDIKFTQDLTKDLTFLMVDYEYLESGLEQLLLKLLARPTNKFIIYIDDHIKKPGFVKILKDNSLPESCLSILPTMIVVDLTKLSFNLDTKVKILKHTYVELDKVEKEYLMDLFTKDFNQIKSLVRTDPIIKILYPNSFNCYANLYKARKYKLPEINTNIKVYNEIRNKMQEYLNSLLNQMERNDDEFYGYLSDYYKLYADFKNQLERINRTIKRGGELYKYLADVRLGPNDSDWSRSIINTNDKDKKHVTEWLNYAAGKINIKPSKDLSLSDAIDGWNTTWFGRYEYKYF